MPLVAGMKVALHGLAGGRRQLLERLTVEITETTAIHDLDQTMAFVDALKEFGCKVAIDDFGAGYTSFRNLRCLAVDKVKIDGSFIQNLASDPANRVFVETLVSLARAFRLETVAEWVQIYLRSGRGKPVAPGLRQAPVVPD